MAEWTERERAAWRLGVREDARNNRNSVLEGMDRSHGIGCLAHHAEGFAVACARIREEVAEIETAHLSVVQSEDPQWWDGLSHGAQTALAIIDRIAGEGM
jgi:hypothetical protein